MARKLAWFIGLWTSAVFVAGATAFVLRAFIPH
jgi:hypothetical protein